MDALGSERLVLRKLLSALSLVRPPSHSLSLSLSVALSLSLPPSLSLSFSLSLSRPSLSYVDALGSERLVLRKLLSALSLVRPLSPPL